MSKGQVARARLRNPSPEKLAAFDEDVADVLREVAEEVSDVLVGRDAAARQLRSEAIDAAAAICMDKAPDERFRLAPSQLELPVGEVDLSEMLASRSVLRECVADSRMRDTDYVRRTRERCVHGGLCPAHVRDDATGEPSDVGHR